MRLLSLSLEHFRNYTKLGLDLSGDALHFFVGPNGSGKTNLLEAIGVLSLTKSFLDVEEPDLVEWEQDFYRLKGKIENDLKERRVLEVVYTKQRKACFLNDVPFAISNFVGMMPTVTFLPQDLDLFTGPPAARRRFLDRLLCQVFAEYLRNVTEYQKVLKQRNALLRRMVCITLPGLRLRGSDSRSGRGGGGGPSDELLTWNERLAYLGSTITIARLELIETLNCTFLNELKTLGESFDNGSLVYERQSTERTQEELMKELQNLLVHSMEHDLRFQTTSVGPHRDDWTIELNDRSLVRFASRGQQRVCLLALLFLQVSYLQLRKNEKPVVLLDDVFSELDREHQRALLRSFEDHQVLITTTCPPERIQDGMMWAVENGKVRQVQKVL